MDLRARVAPSSLHGAVPAIASKSVAHRALILAACGNRPMQISCATTSQDIEATIRCLNSLGAQISSSNGVLTVVPLPRTKDGLLRQDCRGALLDCGESGSTLRFLLPVCCALGACASFTGQGRLPERPLSPMRELLEDAGCQLDAAGVWPLGTAGVLELDIAQLSGSVSSQFATGLMLACAVSGRSLHLHLTPPVESVPYIAITCDVLRSFGVHASMDALDSEAGLQITIQPPQRAGEPGKAGAGLVHSLDSYTVEGDWSNAAFWLCAGAIGSHAISVQGLNPASSQGDRAVLDILQRFGARICQTGQTVTVAPSQLSGISIDAADIPDLAVPLALVAACATGQSQIVNAGRLRAKESDRLSSLAGLLARLGVKVEEEPAGLRIHGLGSPGGPAQPAQALFEAATVDSCNDHRMVMTAALASLRAKGPVCIRRAQAVEKSYPQFFDDFRALGGRVEVVPETG